MNNKAIINLLNKNKKLTQMVEYFHSVITSTSTDSDSTDNNDNK